MTEKPKLTEKVVETEMARIRRLFVPSTSGDKEDLISYAKEIVRLRAKVSTS